MTMHVHGHVGSKKGGGQNLRPGTMDGKWEAVEWFRNSVGLSFCLQCRVFWTHLGAVFSRQPVA